MADPLRHPLDGLASLTNPIGSVVDKVRVGLFRLRCLLGSLDALLAAPEVTTLEKLRVRNSGADGVECVVCVHGGNAA